MIREHWRELAFWRWWFAQRAPREVRWGLGLLGLVLVLGGGFLAADRLSQARAGVSPTGSYTFETTVVVFSLTTVCWFVTVWTLVVGTRRVVVTMRRLPFNVTTRFCTTGTYFSTLRSTTRVPPGVVTMRVS